MVKDLSALKIQVETLYKTLQDWRHIEPEGLALKKACQILQENDDNMTKLATADTSIDVIAIFRDAISSIESFIQEETEGQDLWGNMLWKTRRDLLISQYRFTWHEILFERLDPLMKTVLSLGFPFYSEPEHFKEDMIAGQKDNKNNDNNNNNNSKDNNGSASYRYYLSLFGQDTKPANMWSTFMTKYQAQFGVWDSITHDCLKYLLCTDNNGEDMNIYGYIAITREYGFPLDMEKLPLTMLSPPPAPSEQARVETAKMIMDLVTYFSSKEMRDHLIALYTWFKGYNKRDKEQMQTRANQWARVTLEARAKDAEIWTEEEKLADKVDLARRTISLFYQKYMVMWRMGQFARDLFTDVDFPGKGRIFEMKEHVLPLDHANYHIVIHGDPSKWASKRPKIYKFLDQVVKEA
ncbi:uncharacterized protein BX664DRAFT_332047 [Halteromyces radiatus]|uniref:uncharacterized protein n=1 Tax=Halteromyces radiatus TaxID=101107 RepID=UPI0022207A6C|nr:uncharacterized protein BX664DRAFT_332047 [Halteromyces radiatus]KAI8089049.1 hypothetical protein BX664DRAFT_332047 [Halteromyces radiatus]